jgi:hypothetical protein
MTRLRMEKLLTMDAPVWWEPGTPGVLDIGDISVFLGALVALATIFVMVSKWWMRSLRKIINEEITLATEPIHPNANGGLSLADVARKTTALEGHMLRIEIQNNETKELLAKVLAQAVIIPDTVPEEPRRSRSRSASEAKPRTRKKPQ